MVLECELVAYRTTARRAVTILCLVTEGPHHANSRPLRAWFTALPLLPERPVLESVPDDRLYNQPVCTPSHPQSSPKVDLPVGRDVQVDRRKELLFLLRQRVKVADRSQAAVVLQATGNLLRKVVAELHIGREVPAFIGVGSHE